MRERAIARDAPTLDDVWDRAEREHYSKGKTWDRQAKAYYENYIKPSFGRERINGITRSDVRALFDKMAKTPTNANRMLGVLAKLINLAMEWELLPEGANPCKRIKKNRERKRGRYASAEELVAISQSLFNHALEDKRNLTGAAFLFLLIFSGARPKEIGTATPDMITRYEQDGKTVGVLRLSDHKTGDKTGEDRLVSLPSEAMKVLDLLPTPRRYLVGRSTLPKKLWKLVQADVGCHDLWMRDMRRTFASTAKSEGVGRDDIGDLLGHKSAQTTMIYDKLFNDDARRHVAKVGKRLAHLLDGIEQLEGTKT